jgi:hypothetical protein
MSFGSVASWSGGTIANHRVFNLASNVNAGTTVTDLDQIYLETGTPGTSNATNYRAIRINNSQGVNRAALVCNPLNGGGNNSYLVLGDTTIPTGNWVIWSNVSNPSYLQGGLLLGTGTNSGYKLDVNGTARTNSTVYLTGLTNVSQTNVVSIDTATGQLYYQAAGGGGGTVAKVEEINLGTAGALTVQPEQLEESKHTTINIFNFLNFT